MKFSEIEIVSKKLEEINGITWHQILLLRSEVFVLDQQCIYTDPDHEDTFGTHIFTHTNGVLSAYCRLLIKEKWHVGRVITHPNFRSQGQSKALIEYAINLASAAVPSSAIELSAQVYLTDYYRKMQFNPQGKMYLEDGIPHLQMVYQP